MQPETVISDYEEALMAGLQAIFPDAEVRGCWFHFAQNVFKNMMKHGLKIPFSENDAFHVWMKLCMGLPLLPTEEITTVWNELKNQPIPDVPKTPFKVSFVFIKMKTMHYILGLYYRN